MTVPAALPAGPGQPRMVLLDRWFRPFWDSATAGDSRAYEQVFEWCHAVIDEPDGSRWFGQLYRCPEGIRRWSVDCVEYLYCWPNPFVGDDDGHLWRAYRAGAAAPNPYTLSGAPPRSTWLSASPSMGRGLNV